LPIKTTTDPNNVTKVEGAGDSKKPDMVKDTNLPAIKK
jgi:hypothetical protein